MSPTVGGCRCRQGGAVAVAVTARRRPCAGAGSEHVVGSRSGYSARLEIHTGLDQAISPSA